jgi:hypothetical protein
MVKEPKYTPDFEKFWWGYPSRLNDDGSFDKRGKWEAFIQWRKLPVDIRQKCLMLVEHKMIKCAKNTPDACRFLSKKRWEDYPDYPIQKAKPAQARQSEPKLLIDGGLEGLKARIEQRKAEPAKSS